jgi:heme-degrading monooxygenase HmoA
MISRIWHGYTTPGSAEAYETLLRDEIITGIEDRSIDGFREIQVFRRDLGDEVEFITVMWFDSLDAVRAFAGEDHEASVVPPAARELLAVSTSGPSTTRCASGGSRSAGRSRRLATSVPSGRCCVAPQPISGSVAFRESSRGCLRVIHHRAGRR